MSDTHVVLIGFIVLVIMLVFILVQIVSNHSKSR